MKIGYARVSTDKQETKAQEAELLKYGCPKDKIFFETMSGVSNAQAGVEESSGAAPRGRRVGRLEAGPVKPQLEGSIVRRRQDPRRESDVHLAHRTPRHQGPGGRGAHANVGRVRAVRAQHD